MQIDKRKLNSIYDQYSNDENRLTHALMHTIASSKKILIAFLKSFLSIKSVYKSGIYEISTQKVPFNHGDDFEDKIESIPDGWIINERNNFGIAIEVKDKKDNIRLGQLKSHCNRIRSYDNSYLVVITPDIQKPKKLRNYDKSYFYNLKVIWKSWDEVYWWLKKSFTNSTENKDNFLLTSMIDYLERRREVLGFQGINFSKGFNVEEAKEILKYEMDELEPHVNKIYTDLVKEGGAITTFRSDNVWDCFGSEDGFNNDIHITLGINEESHHIAIVVPNGSRKAWKRLKYIFSEDERIRELISILVQLRKMVPYLYIDFVQRHFLHRQREIKDGQLYFNVDTLGKPFVQSISKTKMSQIWFTALHDAIENKRNLNGQVAFRVRYFLYESRDIDKPKFINVVKSALKEIKPLYDYLKIES